MAELGQATDAQGNSAGEAGHPVDVDGVIHAAFGTAAPGHGAARMLKSRVLNDHECYVNAVAETSARARDRKCVNPRRTHYPGRDSQR